VRLIAEFVSSVAGTLAIFGWTWNRLVARPRKLSNAEHIRKLEAENEELDESLKKITKGD
jgi:hypothetical protein